MSQLFTSGGQSIGDPASASVLPKNIQDWSPLGWTGWISLQSRDSQESSPTPQFKSINSFVLSFLYSPTLTSIHDYWKNHSLDSVSSVVQSCPTLCDSMNRSMPGLPVHHQLLESTQTHVHWVSDAIQPYHPLSSHSPPAFNLSQHQSFQMSQLFASGSQSIGVSASTSVLPVTADMTAVTTLIKRHLFGRESSAKQGRTERSKGPGPLVPLQSFCTRPRLSLAKLRNTRALSCLSHCFFGLYLNSQRSAQSSAPFPRGLEWRKRIRRWKWI